VHGASPSIKIITTTTIYFHGSTRTGVKIKSSGFITHMHC
jgi:hypothetical protein